VLRSVHFWSSPVPRFPQSLTPILFFLILLSAVYSPLRLHAENLNEILLTAAETGELSAVDEALELGATIDYPHKESGWTALMLSSYYGKKNVVNFLLSKGAEVDARDKVGQTALMAAVSSEKPDMEIIHLLLKHNASVDLQRRKDGWTALMLAVQSDHAAIVKVLLNRKANPKIQNLAGETALDLAFKSKNQDLIEILKVKP